MFAKSAGVSTIKSVGVDEEPENQPVESVTAEG